MTPSRPDVCSNPFASPSEARRYIARAIPPRSSITVDIAWGKADRSLGKLACALSAVWWLASGCATQAHTPATDAAVREIRIQAGDEVRVVTTRRERVSFKVTEVRADRFVGETLEPWRKERRPAGQSFEVPFDELAILQVTRFSPTVAAVAVIVTVSLFAAVTAVSVPAAALMAP